MTDIAPRVDLAGPEIAVAQTVAAVETALEDVAREALRRLARGPGTDAAGRLDPGDEVSKLALGLCHPGREWAVDLLSTLGQSDMPYSTIVENYLAPLALRIGQGWEDDELTFVDVGIGASRLHRVLRRMEQTRPAPRIRRRQTLFVATVPGETHLLGPEMAAGLFRETGWDVELQLGLDDVELGEALSATSATVAGLSATGQQSLPALERAVAMARVIRPDMAVVVGGAIVTIAPEPVAAMAPDGAFASADEALAALPLMAEAD